MAILVGRLDRHYCGTISHIGSHGRTLFRLAYDAAEADASQIAVYRK